MSEPILFLVSNGMLEHKPSMGAAIWEYLYKTHQGCATGVVIAVEFAQQSPQVNRSLFGDHVPERRYPD